MSEAEADRTRSRAHRPWAPPTRRWSLRMTWRDLLFLHWPVAARDLRPLLPPPLELDTFEGDAWIGVVPFRMTGVRPRGLPAVPGLSDFPEINLRTYVRSRGKAGVWFFSLDVDRRLPVWLARAAFHLPYFLSRMSVATSGTPIGYEATRIHRGAPSASFAGRYRPTGASRTAPEGSLDAWLTERYCLYSADRRQRVYRGEIDHAPWPLQPAEVELERNATFEQIGLRPPATTPLAHFAQRLDVVAWTIRRVTDSQ